MCEVVKNGLEWMWMPFCEQYGDCPCPHSITDINVEHPLTAGVYRELMWIVCRYLNYRELGTLAQVDRTCHRLVQANREIRDAMYDPKMGISSHEWPQKRTCSPVYMRCLARYHGYRNGGADVVDRLRNYFSYDYLGVDDGLLIICEANLKTRVECLFTACGLAVECEANKFIKYVKFMLREGRMPPGWLFPILTAVKMGLSIPGRKYVGYIDMVYTLDSSSETIIWTQMLELLDFSKIQLYQLNSESMRVFADYIVAHTEKAKDFDWNEDLQVSPLLRASVGKLLPTHIFPPLSPLRWTELSKTVDLAPYVELCDTPFIHGCFPGWGIASSSEDIYARGFCLCKRREVDWNFLRTECKVRKMNDWGRDLSLNFLAMAIERFDDIPIEAFDLPLLRAFSPRHAGALPGGLGLRLVTNYLQRAKTLPDNVCEAISHNPVMYRALQSLVTKKLERDIRVSKIERRAWKTVKAREEWSKLCMDE